MTRDLATAGRSRGPWLRTMCALMIATTLAVTSPGASASTSGTEEVACPTCRLTQIGAQPAPPSTSFGVSTQALSSDGARTVFVSGAGYEKASLRDETTGRTRVLGRGQFDLETATISPSGTKAAVSSLYDLDGDGHRFDNYQLFVQNLTRKTWRQITPRGPSSYAVGFSASGRRLLYVTSLDPLSPFTGGPVRVVDLGTGQTTTILLDAGPSSGEPGGAAISPDGTKVVFISIFDPFSSSYQDHSNAYLYDLTTATFEPLTDFTESGQNVASVAFTDDGATVAFATDQQLLDSVPAGTLRTYLHDLATGDMTLLSDRAPGVDTGQVSPDGTRIVYRSDADPYGTNPDHTPQLFTHDITTGATTQLTRGRPRLTPRTDRLTWPVAQSHDGTVLAFNTNRNLTGANPSETWVSIRATTCDPPPRPDAAIATSPDGPHTGDDAYSAIPSPEQELGLPVDTDQAETFHVRVENERAATDTLRLKTIAIGDLGYQVRYRVDGTDITTAIQAGTYITGPLAPGDSATIDIEITALPDSAPGSTHTVDLTAISATNPVARDTVRARVTRT